MSKRSARYVVSFMLTLVIALGTIGHSLPVLARTTETVAAWEVGEVYNGGDCVEVDGIVYEAKWWNQNEKPDSNLEWGAWKVVTDTPAPDPKPEPDPNPVIKEWSASATYIEGDQVIFEGKTYEAKWWNQNQKPDAANEWGVWKLISNTPDPDPNPAPNPDPGPVDPAKFKVVGYYPSWQPDKINQIQYDKLTHINYSFAIPTAEGGLRPLENPETAKAIIEEAHKHGVKVLLAVGGWSYNEIPLEPTFVAATSTDAKCRNFANEIMNMVNTYGFDGVDMDWEHPRRDGNSKYQYESLMKYLSEATKKEGKLLTSAVLSGVTADGLVLWDAGGHLDSVLDYVDWINVMAYDGGDGDRHSSYSFAVNSVNYWMKDRGLPAEKVVLGVPFYGRPGWKTYEEILQIDPEAYGKDIVNGMHYNGIPTITKKTEFALDICGGIMIWEISQDSSNQDKSLLNAIYKTVKAAK